MPARGNCRWRCAIRLLRPVSRRSVVTPSSAAAAICPLADFGRVFGAGGTMDAFFKQYLEPNVDKSKAQWTWRQNSELARTLSPETLRTFQRAADIRDAFFQTGGNIPLVQLTVKPLPPLIPGVKLEIGGTTIANPVPPPPALGPTGPSQSQPPLSTIQRVTGPSAMAGRVFARRHLHLNQPERAAVGARADRSVVSVSPARGGSLSVGAEKATARLCGRRSRSALRVHFGLEQKSAEFGGFEGIQVSERDLTHHAMQPVWKACREAGLHRAIRAA